MENSKQFSDSIALGKLLVAELGLDQSSDTLARWMAHHIADVMQVAESSTRLERIDAEDRCRETILSLWKYIGYFPNEHAPLGDMEHLIKTIRALDPDNEEYFYSLEKTSRLDESKLSGDVKNWLELARGIDFSARMLIGMCLKRVASDISQEKHELLKLAELFDEEPSVSHIVNFLSGEDQKLEAVLQDSSRKERVRALKERHARLKSMVQLSQVLMDGLEEDIQVLES